MTFRLTLALCLTCLALPLAAGPQEDADYIVSQSVTRDIFEGALQAQRPLIIGSIETDLRKKGIELKEPDVFFDIFMDEWIDTFTVGMQAETAAIYLNRFSEQELADIAAFYRTDSGQSLIRQTPALMQEGAALGMKVGQRAGIEVGPRLAERLANSDVQVFEDQGLLDRVIDALR